MRAADPRAAAPAADRDARDGALACHRRRAAAHPREPGARGSCPGCRGRGCAAAGAGRRRAGACCGARDQRGAAAVLRADHVDGDAQRPRGAERDLRVARHRLGLAAPGALFHAVAGLGGGCAPGRAAAPALRHPRRRGAAVQPAADAGAIPAPAHARAAHLPGGQKAVRHARRGAPLLLRSTPAHSRPDELTGASPLCPFAPYVFFLQNNRTTGRSATRRRACWRRRAAATAWHSPTCSRA